MDATINTPNQEPQSTPDTFRDHPETANEKSELMQFFEHQVNDIYWAYKDLLRAILENEGTENRA